MRATFGTTRTEVDGDEQTSRRQGNGKTSSMTRSEATGSLPLAATLLLMLTAGCPRAAVHKKQQAHPEAEAPRRQRAAQ